MHSTVLYILNNPARIVEHWLGCVKGTLMSPHPIHLLTLSRLSGLAWADSLQLNTCDNISQPQQPQGAFRLLSHGMVAGADLTKCAGQHSYIIMKQEVKGARQRTHVAPNVQM